jgi:hypothetical protein
MDATGDATEGAATDRLAAHLTTWLGAWPPQDGLTVVESPARSAPGWDGRVYEAVGVSTPSGAVLSVPEGRAAAVRALGAQWPGLPAVLAGALDRAGLPVWLGTLRWTLEPSDLPEAGQWLAATDPRLPEWLHPFGGEALVALVDGAYAAGVGLKRHDRYGVELAVGTEPQHPRRRRGADLRPRPGQHRLGAHRGCGRFSRPRVASAGHATRRLVRNSRIRYAATTRPASSPVDAGRAFIRDCPLW